MCPLHPEALAHFPPHSTPPRCHRALALGALHHTLNSHWFSIFHMVIYMFQCYSLKSSHPLLPLSPEVCSLHLCLSDINLYLITSAKIPLLNKDTLPGTRDEDFSISFWGSQMFSLPVVGFLSMPCYSHGSPEGRQCQIQWLFSVPSLVTTLQYLSRLSFLSFLNPSAELMSRDCARWWLLPSSIVLCIYLLLCLFLLSPSLLQGAF